MVSPGGTVHRHSDVNGVDNMMTVRARSKVLPLSMSVILLGTQAV